MQILWPKLRLILLLEEIVSHEKMLLWHKQLIHSSSFFPACMSSLLWYQKHVSLDICIYSKFTLFTSTVLAIKVIMMLHKTQEVILLLHFFSWISAKYSQTDSYFPLHSIVPKSDSTICIHQELLPHAFERLRVASVLFSFCLHTLFLFDWLQVKPFKTNSFHLLLVK